MKTNQYCNDKSGVLFANGARIIGLISITVVGLAGAAGFAHGQDGDADKPGPRPGREARGERPSPEQMATRMLEKSDKDSSGGLSEAELTEALKARPRPGGRGPRGGAEGEGEGERPRGPRGDRGDRPAPPAPEEVAARMIEQHDADGNAELSKDELVKAIEARPRAGRAGRGGPGGPGRGGPANAG